jgi:hypothetical protein
MRRANGHERGRLDLTTYMIDRRCHAASNKAAETLPRHAFHRRREPVKPSFNSLETDGGLVSKPIIVILKSSPCAAHMSAQLHADQGKNKRLSSYQSVNGLHRSSEPAINRSDPISTESQAWKIQLP